MDQVEDDATMKYARTVAVQEVISSEDIQESTKISDDVMESGNQTSIVTEVSGAICGVVTKNLICSTQDIDPQLALELQYQDLPSETLTERFFNQDDLESGFSVPPSDLQEQVTEINCTIREPERTSDSFTLAVPTAQPVADRVVMSMDDDTTLGSSWQVAVEAVNDPIPIEELDSTSNIGDEYRACGNEDIAPTEGSMTQSWESVRIVESVEEVESLALSREYERDDLPQGDEINDSNVEADASAAVAVDNDTVNVIPGLEEEVSANETQIFEIQAPVVADNEAGVFVDLTPSDVEPVQEFESLTLLRDSQRDDSPQNNETDVSNVEAKVTIVAVDDDTVNTTSLAPDVEEESANEVQILEAQTAISADDEVNVVVDLTLSDTKLVESGEDAESLTLLREYGRDGPPADGEMNNSNVEVDVIVVDDDTVEIIPLVSGAEEGTAADEIQLLEGDSTNVVDDDAGDVVELVEANTTSIVAVVDDTVEVVPVPPGAEEDIPANEMQALETQATIVADNEANETVDLAPFDMNVTETDAPVIVAVDNATPEADGVQILGTPGTITVDNEASVVIDLTLSDIKPVESLTLLRDYERDGPPRDNEMNDTNIEVDATVVVAIDNDTTTTIPSTVEEIPVHETKILETQAPIVLDDEASVVIDLPPSDTNIVETVEYERDGPPDNEMNDSNTDVDTSVVVAIDSETVYNVPSAVEEVPLNEIQILEAPAPIVVDDEASIIVDLPSDTNIVEAVDYERDGPPDTEINDSNVDADTTDAVVIDNDTTTTIASAVEEVSVEEIQILEAPAPIVDEEADVIVDLTAS